MNIIPVVETFGPTVQGEGPNVGARCIFVRVKGCSFRCIWCDSAFTWNSSDYPATEYTQLELSDKLIKLCEDANCKRVVLTGGNPCLYDFTDVVINLHAKYIRVDVETQGDLYPEWLDDIDTIVFSPKAPSSGMPDTYDKIVEYLKKNCHFEGFGQQIAIKIPVFNGQDIDFARKYGEFVNEFNRIHDSQVKLYLSVGNSDTATAESIRDRVLSDYEKLLERINLDPKGFEHVFILPQIHTLVWGNKQGV